VSVAGVRALRLGLVAQRVVSPCGFGERQARLPGPQRTTGLPDRTRRERPVHRIGPRPATSLPDRTHRPWPDLNARPACSSGVVGRPCTIPTATGRIVLCLSRSVGLRLVLWLLLLLFLPVCGHAVSVRRIGAFGLLFLLPCPPLRYPATHRSCPLLRSAPRPTRSPTPVGPLGLLVTVLVGRSVLGVSPEVPVNRPGGCWPVDLTLPTGK
jgi:hypothetical protein